MKRIIPVVAAAALGAVTVAAQDSTEKTRTKVSVDDGRAITLTGCLEQQAGPLFTLRGTSVVSSDDVTTRTRVKTDVDDDGADANVKVRETTRVDREDAPDSKVTTRTTAELPRGAHSKVTVVSVKSLGTSCDAK